MRLCGFVCECERACVAALPAGALAEAQPGVVRLVKPGLLAVSRPGHCPPRSSLGVSPSRAQREDGLRGTGTRAGVLPAAGPRLWLGAGPSAA